MFPADCFLNSISHNTDGQNEMKLWSETILEAKDNSCFLSVGSLNLIQGIACV